MTGVYEIRNKNNEKRYVGSSKKIERRWGEHREDLNLEEHFNPHLQNAWNKYGEDSFKFNILEKNIDKNKLKKKEKEYIEKFESYKEENGYNISRDPEGGDTLTGHPNYDELMKKWSERNSGKRNGFYGKKHKKETIETLRQKFKGKNNPMHNKKHDEEAIEKMKEAAEGRYTLEWFQERYGEEEGKERYEKRCERRSEYMKENNPMEKEEYRKRVSEGLKGKSKSEEHKKNISEARKGKATGSDNVNYVYVPEDELKEKIKEGYKSKELANHFDTSQNTITRKINSYWDVGLRKARKTL